MLAVQHLAPSKACFLAFPVRFRSPCIRVKKRCWEEEVILLFQEASRRGTLSEFSPPFNSGWGGSGGLTTRPSAYFPREQYSQLLQLAGQVLRVE
jgi:hypothetical protein